MSSEISINVENVSKCYNVYSSPADRLKQAFYPKAASVVGMIGARGMSNGLRARQAYREFWALRDVSFDIHRGETVGIVGRNGSGKSTLLQMIAGTLNPTAGVISVTGRLAALLELGSGFNPDFTGIENVRLNAAVLGLTPSEIDQKMDAILAFADIGDFVDRPVKTYSSGMMVRLAFAVQAQVDPDILIVDEALAVGDARFQAKCFARLETLKRAGTSILFVSHSTEQIVSHCDRAILLHDGAVHQRGLPKDVVHTYLDLLFGKGRQATKEPAGAGPKQLQVELGMEDTALTQGDAFQTRPNYNPYEFRWGDGAAAISDFRLVSPTSSSPSRIEAGTPLVLELGVCFHRKVHRPIFGITIKSKDGITVFGTNTELKAATTAGALGEAGSQGHVRFAFDCRLGPGDYFISVGIASRDGDEVVPHDRRYDSIHLNVVGEDFFGLAKLDVKIDTLEADR
ncbi:MAG TPA: ABC transporter ATP-binding protein [Lysobacter sp.]